MSYLCVPLLEGRFLQLATRNYPDISMCYASSTNSQTDDPQAVRIHSNDNCFRISVLYYNQTSISTSSELFIFLQEEASYKKQNSLQMNAVVE